MRTRLSPADRYAACVVALASLLLCAGVRYVFHLPSAVTVVSTDRPHLP